MNIKDIIGDELSRLSASEKAIVLESFTLMGKPSKTELEQVKNSKDLFKKNEAVLRKIVKEEITSIIKEKVTPRQVSKAFDVVAKISMEMLSNLEKYKAADEAGKEKYKKIALQLTRKKKDAQADMDRLISMLDKDQQLYYENGLKKLQEKGPGIWANIHAKRKRGEKMRKKGDKGAPSKKAWDAAKGD